MSIKTVTAGLIGAACLLGSGKAHADLSADLSALLLAAHRHQGANEFLATAELVASVTPGGRADVYMAVAEAMPQRLNLVSGWRNAPVTPSAADSSAASNADSDGPERSIGGAPVAMENAPGGSGGWLSRPVYNAQAGPWRGNVSFGVQIDQGNTDLADFTVGFELDKALARGWGLDSRVGYAYSEVDGDTIRDDWLVEARLDRVMSDGFGYYLGGSFEDDETGSYDRTGFVTGGAIWHALDNERFNWVVRAGVGQRYRLTRISQDAASGPVAELASQWIWRINTNGMVKSETTALSGEGSRIVQAFTLQTPIAGHWSFLTRLNIRHEFEAEPGLDPTQTGLDIALSREF